MDRIILRDNKSFRDKYSALKREDVIVGLLNLKPAEEFLFLDLRERGIRLFPSALSQKLSRSKCLQALILKKWMMPATMVVRDRHDMVKAISSPQFIGKKIITKQDRMNCGLGINLWEGIEAVYNQTIFGMLSYPFVIQPFMQGAIDVRVIVLGDYIEAYWRKNAHTFRNNIFFGSNSGRYELNDREMSICQEVMERGRYPYAHIDLMVFQDSEEVFLSEINLRGGLKGAQISHKEYEERIREIEDRFIDTLLSCKG